MKKTPAMLMKELKFIAKEKRRIYEEDNNCSHAP